MDEAKLEEKEAKDVYRFSVSNVYEIVVASAREAKRMNERFFASKTLPPENVSITAIEKVIDGSVAYSVDGKHRRAPKTRGEDVDGHS